MIIRNIPCGVGGIWEVFRQFPMTAAPVLFT
nr:MAG TPA: hypothetical protein [Caudoviricetes sp.]